MKCYRMLAFALLLLIALLFLAAAGCKSDKKDSGDQGTAGQTPAAEEPADGGDGDGGGDGADGGDGGETPAPPPDDGGGDGDIGSVNIRFDGEVPGDLVLSGMTCDFFPNTADDGSDDVYVTSISGTVNGDQHTLNISAYPSGATEPSIKLTRSDLAGEWQSLIGAAGTVTVTDDGGEVSYPLPATETSTATGEVQVEGDWTCPDGMYTPLEQ
jgi:hypothetical protein